MIATETLRVYDPASDPFLPDGYPFAWHNQIKDAVREDAGYRCVRCHHPYRKGDGEWSRCDDECTHFGPVRYWKADGWTICEGEHPHAPGSSFEARWRILTVHHLDGDKANCRWWNLASLCQRCHLTIQGRVVMARVWPWEHSEWFRPYVAGYYASVYLGEELTRDETEARLDELLGLERAA